MLVMKSLFRSIDPLETDAKVAWDYWWDCMSEARDDPSDLNVARSKDALVKVHYAIGRLASRETKRNKQNVENSHQVDP